MTYADRIPARRVAQAVADHYSLTMEQLRGPCRQRPIARPRQLAMAITRDLCPHLSYPAIGRFYGDRDHTTVLHGVRKIDELRQTDAALDTAYRIIVASFAVEQRAAVLADINEQIAALCAHKASLEGMAA